MHATETVVDADHPAVLVGTDQGPTPAELLLNALASCLMAGLGNIAAARGVELRGVRCRVEGDIDLRGILGIGEGVRNGFDDIRVTFEVDGDADAEKLESLVRQSGPLRGLRRARPRHGGDRAGRQSLTSGTGEEQAMTETTALASGPQLHADAVSRTVRGRTLVDRVSLAVPAGEMVALIGGSGAGETSLLETLVGRPAATSGSVTLGGVDVGRDRGRPPRCRLRAAGRHHPPRNAAARRCGTRPGCGCPRARSAAEADRVVEETMRDLDLADRAEVPVVHCPAASASGPASPWNC